MPALILLLLLQAEPPRVPEGFTIAKAAEARFPMFATFDDRSRLYVTESSGGDLYLELQKKVRGCRIRRFEDKDGDGVFETSTVFAENLTPSMGIAWHQGKIYVADPPDLATLEDLDDDGKADRRRVILTGFGHQDNGSLHGIVFGPDGLLYMTTGEPDGYSLPGRDGTPITGMSGALIRCRPDGSGVEVVARGFENLVEVVFLPGGDILGTCNWYQKPAGGIRDAIVHLVDGGLYPYAPDKGTPFPVTGGLIPPLALFPAVALSGFARYEGAAFPEALRGNLFSAQHNTRKVQRHVLARSGSTWTAESHDFVTCTDPDFHPSDVLEAPDGSLIVVDTGAWYVQHCPTGKIRKSEAPGGIWRVRAAAPAGGKRAEPARIPVGLSVELLQKWLPDPAASRALARLAAPQAAAALVDVLKTGDAPQRFAAAEALATCGTRESLPAIWTALSGEPDRFLEHALIHAAGRIGDTTAIQTALRHEHPRVQKAALILLDPRAALSADVVLALAGSGDPALRTTAAGILQRHAEWSAPALTLLRTLLERKSPDEDAKASLRGLLLAFQGQAGIQQAAASALLKGEPEQRRFLLEILAQTTLPIFPPAWRDALEKALGDEERSLPVRLEAFRTVTTLQLPDFDRLLLLRGDDDTEIPSVRLEALRGLVRRNPGLPPGSLEFLRGLLLPDAPAVSQLAAADILQQARFGEAFLETILLALRRNRLLSPALFMPALRAASGPALEAIAGHIRDGWRPAPAELGPLLDRLPADAQALIRQGSQEQRRKIAEFEPLLKGGDAEKGREVFHGKKVGCIACHSIGAQGGRVGPDLTKIGAIRAGRDLLESILFPSSTFAQGYEPYLVRTQDGAVLSGLLARQSGDAVTLRDAAGGETQLRRDRIKEMKRAEKSIMPEGLERALTEQEFRDLLAYLQGLK